MKLKELCIKLERLGRFLVLSERNSDWPHLKGRYADPYSLGHMIGTCKGIRAASSELQKLIRPHFKKAAAAETKRLKLDKVKKPKQK